MTTSHLNRKPRLQRALMQQTAPKLESFMLLDVGCSGGFHPLFHQFGERLHAVGFDPVLGEVERLNKENTNPNLKYEGAFVGAPGYERLFSPEERARVPTSDFFGRTSAARLMQAARNDAAPAESKMADHKVGLDDYCAEHGLTKVDFIKVDTDGSDYEVLTGAEKLLKNGVLGASVEAQFHGPVHDHANVFCNIDRLMRAHGFALFDLDVYRYSRRVLPMPFALDMAAQTQTGAASWGEAVYFRDLGDKNYEKQWNTSFTSEDVVKLACLFDLFNLGDCAAELILNRPEAFAADKRDEYLDLLVPPMKAGRLSYKEFNSAFDTHPQFWYPRSGLFDG